MFVASDYPFLDVFWTMIIFLPVVGALTYLIVNGDGMAKRNVKESQQSQERMDDYVRSVAGGSASEIEKAKQLLDSGAITADEYVSLKARALAGGTA